MYNYANAFSISVSDTNNEFVICCKQVSPVVDTDGMVSGTQTEDVAKIILNRDGMRVFKQMIADVKLDDAPQSP